MYTCKAVKKVETGRNLLHEIEFYFGTQIVRNALERHHEKFVWRSHRKQSGITYVLTSFDRGRREPNVDQSDRSSLSYFNHRCPYFWKTGKKEKGKRKRRMWT